MSAEAENPKDVTRIETDAPVEVDAEEFIAASDMNPEQAAAAVEAAARAPRHEAPVKLLASGKAFIDCPAKMIAMKACRRFGKTFCWTRRIANRIERGRQTYHMFSGSQRQSVNAMAQLAVHVRADEQALHARGKRISLRKLTQTRLTAVHADGSETQYTKLSVRIPGLGQAVALPASPDTCVGATGSVGFDEFGTLKKTVQEDMFAYLLPMVMTRPEFECVIISTPRGLGTKFHEIFTSERYARIFKLFSVDIHQAIREGAMFFDHENNLVTDDAGIERLRAMLNDEDKWLTEFLVQFAADIMALLSPDWIANCESLHDPDGREYEILDFDVPKGFDAERVDLTKRLQLKGGPLFLGFDQARRKDLSEIWVDEEIDGRLWQRGLITMRDIDFELQEQVLWQFLAHPRLAKAGIDATGMGMRTAERAVTRFGGAVVAVNFGGTLKDRNGTIMPAKSLIARTIRERHQGALDRYPIRDKIRDDFQRVKRKAGANPDTFTYFSDADETGHADIFTAKALSDLVAQELREYGGRCDGLRLAPTEEERPENRRLTARPVHPWDRVARNPFEDVLAGPGGSRGEW